MNFSSQRSEPQVSSVVSQYFMTVSSYLPVLHTQKDKTATKQTKELKTSNLIIWDVIFVFANQNKELPYVPLEKLFVSWERQHLYLLAQLCKESGETFYIWQIYFRRELMYSVSGSMIGWQFVLFFDWSFCLFNLCTHWRFWKQCFKWFI